MIDFDLLLNGIKAAFASAVFAAIPTLEGCDLSALGL